MYCNTWKSHGAFLNEYQMALSLCDAVTSHSASFVSLRGDVVSLAGMATQLLSR